jgi:urease accessory protein
MNPLRMLATPALALGLAAASGTAFAHPGHESASFITGFAHPFGGLDHLLAMLAVGLYAARQSGTAWRALPAGFVLAMLAGAGLGAAGIALPAVETGIAASVLVLGLLIALAARLALGAALPLVAAFAVFHGHAHHAEMGGASLATYVAGFVLATALLHGIGYALARWMPQTAVWQRMQRMAGGAIAATGAVLLGA